LVAQTLGPIFIDRGSKLYVAFLLGIAAYLYRDRLPYSWRLFGGCVVFCAGISLFRPAPWMTAPLLNLVVAPVAVYMTVFIGHTRIPRLPILGSGDYSYGIYLYGNPIQQAVRAALPWTNTAWLNLLFSVPLIIAFAAFSWHCLEKPLLRLRRRFSFVARVRGVEGPGESKVGAPPPDGGQAG
jgi:peptidoglycan/LPS O-acetylase OafA/YrhL